MEDRPYWNMDIEPLLNTPALRPLQWEKLQYTLRFAYDEVPFDRERMDAAGVRPEDVRSFDDFARALRPCGQAEFRAVFERFDGNGDEVFAAERMEWHWLIKVRSRRRRVSGCRRPRGRCCGYPHR